MPTLYPKKALMYDTENFTPTEGQTFTWDEATESVVPITNSVNGIVVQTGSGTGASDVQVAAIAISEGSTISINGNVNVTSTVNSTNYLQGDCAVWGFSSGLPVIVHYKGGISFNIQPTSYDGATPSVTPDRELSIKADFADAYLYITCAANVLYVYYRPSAIHSDVTDEWATRCSLNVCVIDY